MTVLQQASDTSSEHLRIAGVVSDQRRSFLEDGYPGAALRLDRLDRLADLLRNYRNSFCEALTQDYGSRSRFESVALDIYVTLESIKYCRRHTRRWMLPEARGAKFPLNLLGATAQVFYQPLGVVGIISPWNFPVQLAFSPLANALSAGNRALIKPSELTPATSEVMADAIAEYFSPNEVCVITGGVETARIFSEQRFDHLIFTGAPSIARHVMRAASENLVPLTLELGGKCPVVIGKGANLETAAKRVMAFKTINAGQICLAPDYTFVPEPLVDAFARHCSHFVTNGFSELNEDTEYTSVINERHYTRVSNYLDEAKSLGCRILPLGSKGTAGSNSKANKIAPTLVINPPLGSKIMTEEIFGPVMPVVSYRDFGTVVEHINAAERPLALYYFGNNREQIARLKHDTTSGGMVVNDIAAHVLQDTMPLGGVGHSGMGSYHGFDGFRQLSHGKAFYHQGLLSLTGLFGVPRKPVVKSLIEKMTE